MVVFVIGFKKNNNNKLVILSVPIIRTVKSIMSDKIIHSLTENADVILIGPYRQGSAIHKIFKGKGVELITWDDSNISKNMQMFLKLPEMIRRLGYWRRHKNEMAFYLKNQYKEIQPDGNDNEYPIYTRIALWLCSIAGYFKNSWRFFELILGSKWYQNKEVIKASDGYKQVILVQSANWTLQERALARLSQHLSWRKVLLPYSTDQTITNGYFLNNFDAVMAQGPCEYNYSTIIHGVNTEKVFKLGACWNRVIDSIKGKYNDVNSSDRDDKKLIIYAGISNLYHPTESEIEAVDKLCDIVESLDMSYRVIYRPVVEENLLKKQIEDRFSKRLTIQWPEEAFIGTDGFESDNFESSLDEYVLGLKGCKLFISSSMTSMCLDAAYIAGSGLISNMIDSDSKMLAKRHAYLQPLSIFPGVKFVYSMDEFETSVKNILINDDVCKLNSEKLVNNWDYNSKDFIGVLRKGIFG